MVQTGQAQIKYGVNIEGGKGRFRFVNMEPGFVKGIGDFTNIYSIEGFLRKQIKQTKLSGECGIKYVSTAEHYSSPAGYNGGSFDNRIFSVSIPTTLNYHFSNKLYSNFGFEQVFNIADEGRFNSLIRGYTRNNYSLRATVGTDYLLFHNLITGIHLLYSLTPDFDVNQVNVEGYSFGFTFRVGLIIN